MSKLYHIEVERGGTLQISLTLKNPDGTAIDLTGCTASAAFAKAFDAAIAGSFDIAFGPDRTTGKLEASISKETTAGLDAGSYVYDLRIVFPSGAAKHYLKGNLTVNPAVVTA